MYSITKNATLAKFQERRETRHLRQLRPHKNEKWPLVEERTPTHEEAATKNVRPKMTARTKIATGADRCHL